MICPQCGSTQTDDLKFCKSCGANLSALRQLLAGRDPNDKFDWSKTWVAEMFQGSEQAVRRAAELERLQGKTPETKRRNEIKAGVITASIGAALMVFLFALMGGIIASGRVSDAEAAILSRIWLAGLIPLFIGLALIINGTFISKKGSPSNIHQTDTEKRTLGPEPVADLLPPAETNQLTAAVPFSVTDETTRHLNEPARPKPKASSAE
ncbi:MAG: hypothetical protein IT174_09350 [Acidobacteria bacterium]|nr:hypothetical protein [Acidobacteriota bacterium]